jgi:hypothetical protein
MSIQSNERPLVTGMVLIFVFVSTVLSRAACIPRNLATPAPKDPVASALAQQDACPKSSILRDCPFRKTRKCAICCHLLPTDQRRGRVAQIFSWFL